MARSGGGGHPQKRKEGRTEMNRTMSELAAMEVPARSLDDLPPFSCGSHDSPKKGACVMEAVSYVGGESWTDRPGCCCPVIGAVMRHINDALPSGKVDLVMRPRVHRLVGTCGGPEKERERSMAITEWTLRTYAPAFLRAAGLPDEAGMLENGPEIRAGGGKRTVELEAERVLRLAAGAAGSTPRGSGAMRTCRTRTC